MSSALSLPVPCGLRSEVRSDPVTAPMRTLTAPVAALVIVSVLVGGCTGSQDIPARGQGDVRETIRLSQAERETFRRGMRQYLASVQGIVEALAHSNRAQISESAQKAGMDMLRGVSVSVAVHLPPEFLMLSMDTHQKFDALSRSAEAGDSKAETTAHLGAILANCTACHAKYRLSPN
ncbi:hypothetical protein [Hyphomicrobium sp.]|uniref:hypothetical protein n=1 Tax=Hyphomicrobium sp. TaxID=82 RepID=UPI002FE3B832